MGHNPLGEELYNQPSIDSIDQYQWRNEQSIIYTRIENFCQTNKIKFSINPSDNLIENIVEEKIIFVGLFDLIPDYSHWEKVNLTCAKSGKMVFVITDNILNFDNLEFVNFFSYPELLGVTASYDTIATITPPKKLYNCFIHRVDSVRQSWFYFLHYHNLLDKGYVSFLLKQLNSYSVLTGKDLFDYIHQHYKLNQLPHFEQAYQSLKNQVPYRNFFENYNLLPLIQDSKYSLVLETYANNDDKNQWCFTEKILRALQFPPFVLPFCQKGSITILKSLGLEFNLDLIQLDHLNWIDRQQRLLNFLIDDPVEFNADMLYNISLHNQQLLKSWKSKYQKPDFFDNVFNEVTEL